MHNMCHKPDIFILAINKQTGNPKQNRMNLRKPSIFNHKRKVRLARNGYANSRCGCQKFGLNPLIPAGMGDSYVGTNYAY